MTHDIANYRLNRPRGRYSENCSAVLLISCILRSWFHEISTIIIILYPGYRLFGPNRIIWTSKITLYKRKLQLWIIVLDLHPIGRLTYIHLDIIHFNGIVLSIRMDPKLHKRIVQVDNIYSIWTSVIWTDQYYNCRA